MSGTLVQLLFSQEYRHSQSTAVGSPGKKRPPEPDLPSWKAIDSTQLHIVQ